MCYQSEKHKSRFVFYGSYLVSILQRVYGIIFEIVWWFCKAICRGMFKIVIWFGGYFSHKNNAYLLKISIVSSYALGNMDPCTNHVSSLIPVIVGSVVTRSYDSLALLRLRPVFSVEEWY